MPGSNSPDYAATQLLADTLSSQRGSLYELVPQGKALYAGFQLSSLPEASLGYALAVYPKGGDGDAMVSEVKKILADDAKNGLPSDLVEASKRHELVDAEFQRNSVSGLAMEWSDAVAVEGRRSPDEDIQAIAKATTGDVNRVAAQYLKFNEAITAVLTRRPRASQSLPVRLAGRSRWRPRRRMRWRSPSGRPRRSAASPCRNQACTRWSRRCQTV